MGEHGIIFGAESVRSILRGSKSQTRRVVTTREPIDYIGSRGEEDDPSNWGYFFDGRNQHGYMVLGRGHDDVRDNGSISIPCPYGAPGDRLWIRETWSISGNGPFYRADTMQPETVRYAWRSPIFMPRWASRITLEVTDVRVERLQSITEEDARAEGVESVAEYAELWDSLNRKRAPWSANPYVWAVTFRSVKP